VLDDGGSLLTAYKLEIDDGKNGPFAVISANVSLQRDFLITEGIVKGRTYRFRYSVQNSIGWS